MKELNYLLQYADSLSIIHQRCACRVFIDENVWMVYFELGCTSSECIFLDAEICYPIKHYIQT